MAALTGIKPLTECRHLAEMRRRQGGNSDSINIFCHGHFIDLVGAGEERPDCHLEADIRKGRGNHLLAAIMTILA